MNKETSTMAKIHRGADPHFWPNCPPSRLHNQKAATDRGFKLAVFPMGDPDDDEAPLVSLLWLPPGGVLPRHAHPCHRVEVVVSGSLDIGNGVELLPGDVATSEPLEAYGPHTAGPAGCLSVEIFSEAGGIDAVGLVE
jgi:hypothetical protein